MDVTPPIYLSFNDSNHFHDSLGLSLQEMIDRDIKAEFDDISSGNNSGNFSNMETQDFLNDLDFDTDEDIFSLVSKHSWTSDLGIKVRADLFDKALDNCAAFSKNHLEDMTCATSVMVNPINVMPIHPHHQIKQEHNSQPTVSQSDSKSVSNASVTVTQSPIIVTQTHFNTTGGTTIGIQNRTIKTLKILPPANSSLQQVHSPASSVVGPTTPNSSNTTIRKKPSQHGNNHSKENGFPKPAYSYSCLIALALKNSQTGSMSVSEIYKFMCEHFPYFKTAPSGWKNSVRHNLSLNKCFEKIEKPATNGSQRKGCLWAMNPAKITKMDEEVAKWSRKDPMGIKKGMLMPETLELLERGEMVRDYNANTTGMESEDDDDPRTPTSVSSQGSQGYDSAGSDFVDIEGFTTIPDSSLTELNLQASGSIFEEFESGSPSFFHANYSIVSDNSDHINTIILHKNAGQRIFNV